MKNLLSVIIFCFISNTLFSQDILVDKSYPKDFRQPMDLTPSLSATFGEIRSNHFHSGLDYRTNRREGYPIYAVADGFISRLRVQNGGFGNALYITHNNGYTSVYAHLQRFNQQIASVVKSYQYQKQSFEIDSSLSPTEIPVKKGDIIGWSGNTGSSGGPHLHFEIRDAKTEKVLNPQLFGLDVPDRVKPIISGLYVYPLGGLPFSENTPSRYFHVIGSGGNYKLNQSPVITINGETGFGIIASDQNVAGGNQNGIYSIELLLDGIPIYAAVFEGFYFNESRAINSHIDYPALITSNRKIQKSFVEPGNPLSIYKKLINRGIINPEDEKIHDLLYLVKDSKGNTSTLSFKVKNSSATSLAAKPKSGIKLFYYNQKNEFTTENLKLTLPLGALYSDIDFRYTQAPNPFKGFSSLYSVHTPLIPVHTAYDLSIKTDALLPKELNEKALIIDTKQTAYPSTFENGWVKAQIKNFGSFYVTVDTVAPSIRPVNVANEKAFKINDKMVFKISDSLSGIKSFQGTIDGQWILMEYDAKTNTLWHTFDGRITTTGKHQFQLVVTDIKSNSNTYNATIYYN